MRSIMLSFPLVCTPGDPSIVRSYNPLVASTFLSHTLSPNKFSHANSNTSPLLGRILELFSFQINHDIIYSSFERVKDPLCLLNL